MTYLYRVYFLRKIETKTMECAGDIFIAPVAICVFKNGYFVFAALPHQEECQLKH